MARHSFPDDFLFGTATSALQVEGAHDLDGRGESIWDRFATLEGKIDDGSLPDITCDHYHKWRHDIDLMAWLGTRAYRFSIAWPRILPAGRGAINPAGLEFYDRLVDGLLEAGIEPFPTLYHWDLPQALQGRGGWASRETVDAFVEYAAVMTRLLGDRVRRWVTHNEPWCIATLGHEEGHHAPGHKDPAEGLRVAHHLLLSHGKAVAVIRQEAPRAEVGIVLIHCPAEPATSSKADGDAARWFDGFFNRWYLEPVFHGRYPADAVADRIARGHLPGPDLPFVQDGDMETINAPLDFLGLNYYSRAVMRADAQGNPEAVKAAPPAVLTDMGWEVYPQGLYNSLMAIHREYAPGQIYITENGAAFDDAINPDGSISDSRRITYLREHLLAAARAIEDGVPLQGYFAWSLLDNFEWSFGFTKKFGLFAMEPETRRRIAKDSAFWYRQVATTGTVDDTQPPLSRGESRAHDA